MAFSDVAERKQMTLSLRNVADYAFTIGSEAKGLSRPGEGNPHVLEAIRIQEAAALEIRRAAYGDPKSGRTCLAPDEFKDLPAPEALVTRLQALAEAAA